MHVNLNKYLSGPIENKEVKLLIAHNIVKLSSVCSFIWDENKIMESVLLQFQSCYGIHISILGAHMNKRTLLNP